MATVATYLDTGKTFSPTYFRSSFKKGVAKPSLFHFKITRYPNIYFKSTGSSSTLSGLLGLNNILPSSITSSVNSITKIPSYVTTALNVGETIYQNLNGRGLADLVFKCNRVSLPSKDIETYSNKTYGPSREFPRELENGKFSITVIGTGTYVEHDFFSTWTDKIFDYNKSSESPSFNVAYYDDIVSEAQIISYDEEGNSTYLQTFEEIYPVSVGGIEYDWNEKNEIIEFSVTFAYRIMRNEKIAKSFSIKSNLSSTISTGINTLSNIL